MSLKYYLVSESELPKELVPKAIPVPTWATHFLFVDYSLARKGKFCFTKISRIESPQKLEEVPR